MSTPQLHVIAIVKNAYGLKDSQFFGRQSPQLAMSIGKHSSQQCQTSVRKKGGTSPIWNETLHLQVQQSVQFLTFEIRSGTTFLGSANFPVANLGAPQEYAIKLANQKGKHAGMLNLTLQLYTGDVQVALNLMKATQTSSRAPVGGGFTQPVQQEGGVFSQPVQQGGGGFSQPVQKGGGGFSQPVQQGGGVCIQQQPPSSVAGGFQQPSTAPACRPIGGFTVSGSQLAGGVGVSRDQAGFSTPSTVTANSQGFQGYQQQHNLTERGAYVPQAGASTDGESSYPILPPQPIYNPAAVTHSAPPPTAVVTSTAPPLVESTTYMEEEIPTATVISHPPLPPLPPSWQECTDPASGRTYFSNNTTQTTQWDRPS